MPRRAIKLLSAAVTAAVPKRMKGKRRALVRRMTQGTLLAITLAAARLDIEEQSDKRRLFDIGLVDRLRAPITRIRE